LIDEKHPDGRSESKSGIEGEIEITQALTPMSLRDDPCGQCPGGGCIEGQSDALEEPDDDQQPEGFKEEVGNRRKSKDGASGDHKCFFRDPQQSFSNQGPKDKGGYAQRTHKDADLCLTGTQLRKVDGKGWDETAETNRKRELRQETEGKITGKDLLAHDKRTVLYFILIRSEDSRKYSFTSNQGNQQGSVVFLFNRARISHEKTEPSHALTGGVEKVT
jgi:hypothetical protein